MPLIPSFFNAGKSNLKHLEYSAAGVLGIGTHFSNKLPSPYDCMDVKLPNDCSLKQIEEVIEYFKEPKHYNDVIDRQYKFLDDNGHWLESTKYVNKFVSLL